MDHTGPLARLKAWAKTIRRDVLALWIAARDPRTPLAAKLLCAALAAYALSPIDLIPDVIPVLGLLDEAILLPHLILLAIRLVPPALMAEFRKEAARRTERPVSRAGAAMVLGLWLLALALIAWVAGPAR
jgi:uncharacterized membrane protein YkvA (DUF1232 family)